MKPRIHLTQDQIVSNPHYANNQKYFMELLDVVNTQPNINTLYKSKSYLGAWVIERTKFVDAHQNECKSKHGILLRTRVWFILKGLLDFPKCIVCGNPILKNIWSYETGYANKDHLVNDQQIATCENYSCAQKNPLTIKFVQNYFQAKYGIGIVNPWQAEEVKENCKKTHNKNLGVDNPWKNKKIIARIQRRILESNAREKTARSIIVSKRTMAYTTTLAKIANTIAKPLFTLDEFIQIGLYRLQKVKPLKWQCIHCGNTFESIYHSGHIVHKCPCQKCLNQMTQSSKELEMFKFIKSITSFPCFNRSKENFMVTNGYEIDVVIPDMKLGFEFNGLYWHSIKRHQKWYHQSKSRYAERNGWHLVHIWEDEWVTKNEETKQWIDLVVNGDQFNVVDLNQETIILPHDRYSSLIVPFGFMLKEITQPNLLIKNIYGASFEIFDSGNVIFQRQ